MPDERRLFPAMFPQSPGARSGAHPFVRPDGSVRAMSRIRNRTISLAIASLMLVGAGLLIFFGNWLWFGGVLGKASVVAAALLIAGGLAIAFVREWWMKR